jgi:hypothetical protein
MAMLEVYPGLTSFVSHVVKSHKKESPRKKFDSKWIRKKEFFNQSS